MDKPAVLKPTRRMIAPEITADVALYFSAAAKGELLIKQCNGCGEAHFYPRVLCPFCMSDQTTWIKASGKGTIYSYTVVRRAEPAPYVLAYVTLEEGVTMVTNLIADDPDLLAVGQPVKVAFMPAEDGQLMPVFQPL